MTLLVYLDVDTQELVKKLKIVNYTRLVGQKDKSLAEILDYRKSIYEKYYDVRIVIGDSFTPERVCDEIEKLINKEERFISTRDVNIQNGISKENLTFENVITKGIADDKGLFLPLYYPYFDLHQLERLVELTYEER